MKIIVSFLLIFLENGMCEKAVAGNAEYDNNIYQFNGDPTYVDPDYSQPVGNAEVNYGDEFAQTTTELSVMDCECAIFNSAFPTKDALPILTQVPNYVQCKYDGEEDCIARCSVFAKAAMKHGPELICAILGDYSFLKASLHSRVLCNSNSDWIYTGLTTPDYICCQESKVTKCPSAKESNVSSANP